MCSSPAQQATELVAQSQTETDLEDSSELSVMLLPLAMFLFFSPIQVVDNHNFITGVMTLIVVSDSASWHCGMAD